MFKTVFDIDIPYGMRRNIFNRHHRLDTMNKNSEIKETLGAEYVKKHFEKQDTSFNIVKWSKNIMDSEYQVRLLD